VIQQFINQFSPLIGSLIGEEALDFVRWGKAPHNIEKRSPDENGIGAPWCGRDSGRTKIGEYQSVNLINRDKIAVIGEYRLGKQGLNDKHQKEQDSKFHHFSRQASSTISETQRSGKGRLYPVTPSYCSNRFHQNLISENGEETLLCLKVALSPMLGLPAGIRIRSRIRECAKL
jgi:hypothetical protein